MRYADLHVHTFYSDSTFSPGEVLASASKNGLAAIAICDHDSLDAIPIAEKEAVFYGIEIVPGIEMTAELVDFEIHMLGYFMDLKLKWFQSRLAEIRQSRIQRIRKMCDLLKKEGIDVKPDDVFSFAGKGTVGRLHMAQAMLKTGRVRNFEEIFERFIGFGKPCYVSYTKFSPKEAIECILKAGGVPVLAHPRNMNRDDIIPELVSYGLRGIEAYHTDHDTAARSRYSAIAEKHGLIVTGGSDCHGMGKGRPLIGGVKVPYEAVERLKAEAEKVKRDQAPF